MIKTCRVCGTEFEAKISKKIYCSDNCRGKNHDRKRKDNPKRKEYNKKYLKQYNITKRNSTFDIVGCKPSELKKHLEKQFKEGMTCDNHGEWHIDHILPLASAKDDEEVFKLCHYTNLQPLWAEDNLIKGCRY